MCVIGSPHTTKHAHKLSKQKKVKFSDNAKRKHTNACNSFACAPTTHTKMWCDDIYLYKIDKYGMSSALFLFHKWTGPHFGEYNKQIKGCLHCGHPITTYFSPSWTEWKQNKMYGAEPINHMRAGSKDEESPSLLTCAVPQRLMMARQWASQHSQSYSRWTNTNNPRHPSTRNLNFG